MNKIDQLNSFLMFGGYAFWGIVAIFILVQICIVEDEFKGPNIGWPLLWSILFLVYLGWVTKSFQSTNITSITILNLIIYFFSYLCIGLGWSFLKWIKFVKKEYEEHRSSVNRSDFKPKVGDHIDDIISYIIHWPFSILRWLIGDFLVNFMSNFVGFFSKFYDKLADNFYK